MAGRSWLQDFIEWISNLGGGAAERQADLDRQRLEATQRDPGERQLLGLALPLDNLPGPSHLHALDLLPLLAWPENINFYDRSCIAQANGLSQRVGAEGASAIDVFVD